MKKEELNKQLKELANSSQGIALKELFNEKIRSLTNAKNFSKDDFELDGKSSLKAAKVLRNIMRDLAILKKDKKQSKIKSEYE